MRLSEISQETFGIDIFQFPVLEHLMTEDAASPASPSKSMWNNAHRRSLSGNNGAAASDQSVAYQQCTRMYNLESLALGFDTLEQFAVVYDQISKSVTSSFLPA